MMLNYRGKYIVLKIFPLPHFSKTMKNSYILTLCLIDMCFFSTERTSITFSGLLELVMGYKMMLNCRVKYAALKVCSVLYFSKNMKTSCKLTLITDSFKQFYQNQSVDSFVLLFEVHITFGFQSEVPTFLFIYEL
jgi:hypothetical protein